MITDKTTVDFRCTDIQHLITRPALFIDQPHVPDENGIVKFIYRLKIDIDVSYKMFLNPPYRHKSLGKYITELPEMEIKKEATTTTKYMMVCTGAGMRT